MNLVDLLVRHSLCCAQGRLRLWALAGGEGSSVTAGGKGEMKKEKVKREKKNDKLWLREKLETKTEI